MPMDVDDVLVVIISGKRPGGIKERPTEKLVTSHRRIYISNNADGYETSIPIIMVPDSYKNYYIANFKNSEAAWYAPMNRSYAIKYAKDNGYRYVVQLDDNIEKMEIAYSSRDYRRRISSGNRMDLLDTFIECMRETLKHTNAAMVGCNLMSVPPNDTLWHEGYVYSLFMLDVLRCPEAFQGDFEDDIEYRIKCAEMGMPVIQLPFLRYGKISQRKDKNLTGCRAEYVKQGIKRGEHMSIIHADKYVCSFNQKNKRISTAAKHDGYVFKHRLAPFKVGVIIDEPDALKRVAIAAIKNNKKNNLKVVTKNV